MKSKLIIGAVLAMVSAFALADHHTYGSYSAGGPSADTGGVHVNYSGYLYDDYAVGFVEKLRLDLIVDGTTVWSSGNMGIPNSFPPGLLVDYDFVYPLSSGTHTVTWKGTIKNPADDDVTFTGFQFTNTATIVI